jgi:hypothetical protein
MKIWTGPEAKTESDFSIKGFHVAYSHEDQNGKRRIFLSLIVSLEPSLQERQRGFGRSFETKTYPATLELRFSELHKMIEALVGELHTGYNVLLENNLLSEFYEARKAQKKTRSKRSQNDGEWQASKCEARTARAAARAGVVKELQAGGARSLHVTVLACLRTWRTRRVSRSCKTVRSSRSRP